MTIIVTQSFQNPSNRGPFSVTSYFPVFSPDGSSWTISPSNPNTFVAVSLTLSGTAGSNPPSFIMYTGDAIIGTHSFRLEQSQDNFKTIRTTETVAYTSDFDLSKEDASGWGWNSLATVPAGPWQARIVTVVTATNTDVATSNVISDTLANPTGAYLTQVLSPNSKTGTVNTVAGRNIIVTRDNINASALTVGGVSATLLGTNYVSSVGYGTYFWDVTLPSGGAKPFVFTGSGSGSDVNMYSIALSGYGTVASTNFYQESNQNAYSNGPPPAYSADNGNPTTVPVNGIALHLFIQTSNQVPSPLNTVFIDTSIGPNTFILAKGSRNQLPQGFTLPSSTSNYGSRTYVTFNPAGS